MKNLISKLMTKFITVCLMIICISTCEIAMAGDIELYMFGEEIKVDVAPVIENGRTLVPVRAIGEDGLGADVHWNGKLKQVSITKDDLDILLTIGEKLVLVNGEEEYLDVPAKLISDRTMVPVRFVGEALNYDVGWDDKNRRVTIDEKKEHGSIEDIDIEKTKNDNLLNIKMSELEKPNIFTLKEPHRIVLDFNKTKFDGNDGKINVDSGYITQVRWADHEGFYRIVIECPGEQPYKYVQTGHDKFSIIVGDKYSKVDLEELEQDKAEDEENEEDKDKDNKDNIEDEEDKNPITPPKDRETLVVIDAGHGGKDPGAIGRDEEGNPILDEDGKESILEKDINLSVAKKVYKYLKNSKVNVMMTRSKDEYLELRHIADIANEADATLFVSIHSNSVDGVPSANGLEVLYYNTDGKEEFGITSKKVAENLLDAMLGVVHMSDRGVTERPGLAVLKWTDMPAVLVELGFLTNEEDTEKLTDKSWQEDVAWGMAQGIIKSVKAMTKALNSVK